VILRNTRGKLSDGEAAIVTEEFDLERFVDAQDEGGTYARAIEELRRGRKVSHWMWFVFPQLAGLGQSPMSQRYAISSLPEAVAYLAHPLLGSRLVESTRIVASIHGRSAEDIFGGIDSMKLRSSMTLFARAAPEEPVFAEVLDRFFDGVGDPVTEGLI
jgi:uncharacterized protein (DUF1810 family)